MIRCAVSHLCAVNVEAFRDLGAEAVAGPEIVYGSKVVLNPMQLGDVEVFACTQVDKDLLVVVEGLEGITHLSQGQQGVGGVVREVNEVQDGACADHDTGIIV